MKRIFLYLFILTLGVGQIFAQLPKWALDLGKKGEQVADSASVLTGSMVSCIDAVQPALSIVRQQFCLESGGETFRRKNRQYYGETYSLGVKITGATILGRAAVRPWENDADYQRVNAGGKYNPVFSKSYHRLIGGDEWTPVELELGTKYVKQLTPDSLLFIHTDSKSGFGLSMDETEGVKRGYMIWAYSTTSLQDSSMQVKLQETEMQVDAKVSDNSVGVNPGNLENVLGGIFVVPQVEQIGYIRFFLVGVAVKKDGNQWALDLLTSKPGDLTKVEKSKKEGKQQKGEKHPSVTVPEDSDLVPVK